MCFKFRKVAYIFSNSKNMSNFHPLEVVGRGSETQLQVDENLNFMMQRFKGWLGHVIFIHFKLEIANKASSDKCKLSRRVYIL